VDATISGISPVLTEAQHPLALSKIIEAIACVDLKISRILAQGSQLDAPSITLGKHHSLTLLHEFQVGF
jgi:hypothetical protein